MGTTSLAFAGRVPTFASVDIDKTRSAVARVLNGHRLACERGGVNATLHHQAVGDISIVLLKYGAPVRIEPESRDKFYIAQAPMRGHSRIHSSRRTIELDPMVGAVLPPSASLTIDWSGQCEQLLVKIPVATLDRFARSIFDTSLSQMRGFEEPFMLAEAETRSLVGLIDYIIFQQSHWRDVDPITFDHDAEKLLAGGLLLAGKLRQSEMFVRPRRDIGRKHVRDAEEYMRVNIHRQLLLSEIAQSVGVSVRTLHESFRTLRGTTPIAMLQGLRLASVRNELLTAPPGTKVSDVALRWGFMHLGRFSIAYRLRYGELPSHTIRHRID